MNFSFGYQSYLVIFDKNFNTIFLELKPIQKQCICEKSGYEDPRTIVLKNHLYIFTAALTNSCKFEMQLMTIDIDRLLDTFKQKQHSLSINDIKILKIDFDLDKIQKNWMPFIYNDSLYCVYSVSPHKILKVNVDSGMCELVHTTYYDITGDYRGGSNIITYKDQYLGVIHIRKSLTEYLTYFYTFKTQPPFQVTYISKPFLFNSDNPVIEFASGLQQNGDQFFLSYGLWDCEAKVAVISSHEMNNMLTVDYVDKKLKKLEIIHRNTNIEYYMKITFIFLFALIIMIGIFIIFYFINKK